MEPSHVPRTSSEALRMITILFDFASLSDSILLQPCYSDVVCIGIQSMIRYNLRGWAWCASPCFHSWCGFAGGNQGVLLFQSSPSIGWAPASAPSSSRRCPSQVRREAVGEIQFALSIVGQTPLSSSLDVHTLSNSSTSSSDMARRCSFANVLRSKSVSSVPRLRTW